MGVGTSLKAFFTGVVTYASAKGGVWESDWAVEIRTE